MLAGCPLFAFVPTETGSGRRVLRGHARARGAGAHAVCTGSRCVRYHGPRHVGPGAATQPFTVLGWLVEDIDATADALVAAGVQPLRYEGMDQDGAGVWTAPGGARVLWFTDPDGNTLSLTAAP